jgi:hypothetical protein
LHLFLIYTLALTLNQCYFCFLHKTHTTIYFNIEQHEFNKLNYLC